MSAYISYLYGGILPYYSTIIYIFYTLIFTLILKKTLLSWIFFLPDGVYFHGN